MLVEKKFNFKIKSFKSSSAGWLRQLDLVQVRAGRVIKREKDVREVSKHSFDLKDGDIVAFEMRLTGDKSKDGAKKTLAPHIFKPSFLHESDTFSFDWHNKENKIKEIHPV